MTSIKTYSNQSVTLTPKKSTQKSIKATASCSIMTNYEPSRSVTANHKIKPIQDINGNPIVFSISTNNHLYANIRDTSSTSGWAQYDVSTFVGEGWVVDSFNTYDYGNNTYTLVMALSKNNTTRFFMTSALSADPSASYWKTFSTSFVERPNGLNIKKVASINIGASNVTDQPIIIAEATTDGTNFDRYVINSNPSTVDDLWVLFPLPQNAHTDDGSNPILDVAIGKCKSLGLTGTYSLYYVGKDLQLTFDSIQKIGGQIISHALTVPENAQALSTVVADSDGNTELYVAGNGVFRFAVDKQGSTDEAVKIAPSLVADSQTELEVLCDDTDIAIWFLDQGVLSYVHGTRGATPTWTTPMPIQSDIGQIAALRNTVLKTNEIFSVDASNQLMYFYQDATSTIWRETLISLPDIGTPAAVKCYTTAIHFTDENDSAVTSPVKISSSGWIYATINGGSHILDTNSEVKITPDSAGTITIISKVATASNPVFSLVSDDFEEAVDVNPQNIVNENLKNFTTESSLTVAKTQEGNSVIPNGSKVTAKQAANAFSILTTASDSANSNTISTRDSASSITHKVNTTPMLSSLATKTIAFTDVNTDKPQMLTNSAALAYVPTTLASSNQVAARSLLGDSDNSIEAFFGDVWNAISNGLKEVGSWVLNVVEGGVQFIVHLAEGIVTFVLDTIEKIYEVLSWVLKQIEMGLEKLIQWIGQLFGWDDILTCHKVIENSMNQLLGWMAESPQVIKPQIDDFYNSAATTITGKSLPSDIANSSYTSASSSTKNTQNSGTKQGAEYHKSPAGSFAKYHMVHSGPAQSNTSVDSAIDQTLKDFMSTLENVGQDVLDTTKQVITDIATGLSDGSMTLTQILDKVASDVVLGTLNTMKDFTDGILDIITDVVKLVKAILNYSIEIPFITGLYKLISGDSEFTILNAFSLIIAIPTTTMMKVLTGSNPFKNGALGLDDTSKSPSEFVALVSGNHSLTGTQKRNALLAAPTTLTAAEETMSAGVLYSQIGGAVFIISEAINDVIAVMSTAGVTLGSFAKWCRTLLQAVICGTTCPVVEDSAQSWRLFKWFLAFGGLSVLYCSAVDPTYGPIAGFFNIIFGVAGLVIAFGIPITVSINGNSYQIAMAWTAFVGSIGLFVGNIASGLGKFDPEPETKESLAIAASIGFADKVLFDVIREVIVLIKDSQNSYKPFYA
jgi:hypothetical protein